MKTHSASPPSLGQRRDAEGGAQGVAADWASSGFGSGDSESQPEVGHSREMKSLEDFLESLPILSVSQKRSASFECELNKASSSKVSTSLLQPQRKQQNLIEIATLAPGPAYLAQAEQTSPWPGPKVCQERELKMGGRQRRHNGRNGDQPGPESYSSRQAL